MLVIKPRFARLKETSLFMFYLYFIRVEVVDSCCCFYLIVSKLDTIYHKL